jgi:DNA-binding transcriptional regulator YhcF (GntR family)
MIEIRLSDKIDTPKYRQIVDQIKLQAARYQIKPGDRLPPIHKLAGDLQISPTTVSQAYRVLKLEGFLRGNTGRGSIFTGVLSSHQLRSLRQNEMAGLISNFLSEAFQKGYLPEEIEANFLSQLARWRVQRMLAGSLFDPHRRPPTNES